MAVRVGGAWIHQRGTQEVFDALLSAGFEIYCVGGCIRNELMGEAVSDIDMATQAQPSQMIKAAKDAGLKTVPTGIDHGTITILAGGIAHEVTTFRKDVVTDGRHATVEFGSSLQDDAARRDFTMNALYADRNGQVFDPLGGSIADAQARRVRFIGDADQRIREDYLRSLRYFRFLAQYGRPEHGADPEALDAISRNVQGLLSLSLERVGAEISKLLSAPDPGFALGVMQATGALSTLLQGTDPRTIGLLTHAEAQLDIAPDPMRRLAALGGDRPEHKLRLSKASQKRLSLFRDCIEAQTSLNEIAHTHGAVIACGVAALRSALFEMPLTGHEKSESDKAEQALFPVTSQDLMPAFKGRALGAELRRLKDLWIASGFTLSRSDLLK